MQTESHNTQSVYSILLSAEPNWQYSWQSTEWQTYCNSKLNVTNCNANWKPQHTVCIQHCTVSWTKLTVQLTVWLDRKLSSIVALKNFIALNYELINTTISQSLSPRHDASWSCRLRNGLEYGGQLRMYLISRVWGTTRSVLQFGFGLDANKSSLSNITELTTNTRFTDFHWYFLQNVLKLKDIFIDICYMRYLYWSGSRQWKCGEVQIRCSWCKIGKNKSLLWVWMISLRKRICTCSDCCL